MHTALTPDDRTQILNSISAHIVTTHRTRRPVRYTFALQMTNNHYAVDGPVSYLSVYVYISGCLIRVTQNWTAVANNRTGQELTKEGMMMMAF